MLDIVENSFVASLKEEMDSFWYSLFPSIYLLWKNGVVHEKLDVFKPLCFFPLFLEKDFLPMDFLVRSYFKTSSISPYELKSGRPSLLIIYAYFFKFIENASLSYHLPFKECYFETSFVNEYLTLLEGFLNLAFFFHNQDVLFLGGIIRDKHGNLNFHNLIVSIFYS